MNTPSKETPVPQSPAPQKTTLEDATAQAASQSATQPDCPAPTPEENATENTTENASQNAILQSVLHQFAAMQGFQPGTTPQAQPKPEFHLSHPLILASHSPRRRQLLTNLGIPFECVPSDDSVEKAFDPESFDSPADFVEKQSLFKALNVAEKFPEQDVWILACDTVAVCEGEILGKPADRADARRMLKKLAGSLHEVLSGICLMNPAHDEKTRLDVVTTTLQMENLSDETLAAYLDSQKWRGKAGAFGYQDGNDWIQILHGSASNVVGLPTEKLLEWLAEI